MTLTVPQDNCEVMTRVKKI